MSQAWVLVVEDEPLLGELLVDNLRHEGFGAELVQDGRDAWERLQHGGVDLVILDLMLPSLSGLQVLERLRGSGSEIPVLILSARASEEDRIKGLRLGSDDYVGKPFNLRELLLRVRALLKRAGPSPQIATPSSILCFGSHEIDLESFDVTTAKGETAHLSKKEAMLLRYLYGNAGRVVTRNDILDAVWGIDEYPSPRTVDNFIAKFRKLFEEDPRHPVYFHTLRGVGYRFELGADED